MTSDNPLLAGVFRIPFHRIGPEHVEPGIRTALADAQAVVDAVSRDEAEPTWENVIAPLDEALELLGERIGPAAHLMSVAESAELRAAYNKMLPEITTFWSSLRLNPDLWARVKAYSETDEAKSLEGVRARHLKKTIRSFTRAGADLDAESKEKLQRLQVDLAQLEQKFSENVLDATNAYGRLVSDPARLAGVPEAAMGRARAKAMEKGEEGWLLTLDYPSVEPILKFCLDRELRQEVFVAFSTRCRDGEYDNRPNLARILRIRDEIAEILGYEGFPDYNLEERMARSGARAIEFEADLVERTRPYWQRDVDEVAEHAATLGIDELQPWDIAFTMENLRKSRFDIDDEILRPYFPLPQVQEGMFEIVRRTFGFRIEEKKIQEVWHKDVRYYEIYDEDDLLLGAFYTDWFPRKEKRQGAWMNNFITGGPREDGFAPHLGVICGNFTPPDGERPALLTHREVETTFHEFGHLLHHCTSRVEIPSRAGIHVAWDWVELPSQLMENWTWEREALDLVGKHYETGEPLPDEIFERMLAARRFMGGWAQMRQLSLGTVDLALHQELAPALRQTIRDHDDINELDARQGSQVMEFGQERFAPFSPNPDHAQYHILTSFSHLFAGGYAAGYYSYLWSEVLDADVFTRFKSEGVFNRDTGRDYVESILSRGDSADPEDLFVEFMGRPPDPEALFERNLGTLPA